MNPKDYYAKLLRDIDVPLSTIKKARTDRERAAKAGLEILAAWDLPGRRWYPAGALAMGTQIDPLNDWDLVLEVGALRAHWRERPRAALEELCSAFEARLAAECEVRTHAVKLSRGNLEFTGDVVLGCARLGGGIELPHCPDDEPHRWIESDPREHARLIRARNERIGTVFSKEIRILKHLNRRWGMQDEERGKPLSSWHLAALALEILTEPFTHEGGTPYFLENAAQLVLTPLADPAGIGPHLEAHDPARASALLAEAGRLTRLALDAGGDANGILEQVFGDAALLRAAVSGGAVAVGAGGAFTLGSGRPVHTDHRSHGDDA